MQVKEMKKFNRKEFQKYLIESIDSELYDIETNSDREKLLFIDETFRNEYGFNIERLGYKHAFAEWLSGLPSAIDIEFRNHYILSLGKSFNADLSTEKKENDFLENWWLNCAASLDIMIRRANSNYKSMRY